MRRHTASECTERIDAYARNEGPTESEMRMACGLLGDPPGKIQAFAAFGPVQEARAGRRRIIDALASVQLFVA